MRISETALCLFVAITTLSVVTRLSVASPPSRVEEVAAGLVRRSSEQFQLASRASSALIRMQRLASAQATLQAARELVPDATLERLTGNDVAADARRHVKALSREHARQTSKAS